jgi:hypothetical protein
MAADDQATGPESKVEVDTSAAAVNPTPSEVVTSIFKVSSIGRRD